VRPTFGDVEAATEDLGTDGATTSPTAVTRPDEVTATVAHAVQPGGDAIPAPRRAHGQPASEEPGPAEPSPPGGRRRAAVSWSLLGRGVCVAVVASAALAGCLPRLWDAARDQDPSACRLAVLLAGVLMLLARSRPRPDEPDIHDRQVDYLVGLPLLATAAAVLTVLPARFPDRFWAMHADLLAVPPLLAGAIAVTFGTRALWRQRATLAVWPFLLAPYPAGATRRVAESLGRPELALAHLTGPRLAGWGVVSSSPGDLVAVPAGARGEVAFGAATHGLAGGLAALCVVLLVTAAADRRDALARAAVAALGCGLVLAVRVLLAVIVGTVSGAAGAGAVLGPTGDLLTLTAMLSVAAGLAGRAIRTRGRGRAPGTGPRRARRAAVPRAHAALVVLALVCAGLAFLDVAGNRGDAPTQHLIAVRR
jgi:hypothetical protein